MRLNIRTFFTLLQVLQPELERFAGEEAVSGANGSNGSDKITAVARRVLPGLRHYSSWLTIRAKLLIAQIGDSSLNVQTKELWKTYANTLTLLASTFPVHNLLGIDYLLEEDEDTLGFKPLDQESTVSRYYGQEPGIRKPKYHDHSIERHHPNIEMLGRIRDLLVDGLKLQLDEVNLNAESIYDIINLSCRIYQSSLWTAPLHLLTTRRASQNSSVAQKVTKHLCLQQALNARIFRKPTQPIHLAQRP